MRFDTMNGSPLSLEITIFLQFWLNMARKYFLQRMESKMSLGDLLFLDRIRGREYMALLVMIIWDGRYHLLTPKRIRGGTLSNSTRMFYFKGHHLRVNKDLSIRDLLEQLRVVVRTGRCIEVCQ